MPELPDIQKVADGIAEGGKAVIEGAVEMAQNTAEKMKIMALGTIKSMLGTAKGVADEAVKQAEANIEQAKGIVQGNIAGAKKTGDKIQSEINKGASETVGRVKREIEKQIK